MTDVSIYVLKDPGTGEVLYVGQSIDPKRRLSEHVSERRLPFIEEMIGQGQTPTLEVVCCVPADCASCVEAAIIAAYRSDAPKLVNKGKGGIGGIQYRLKKTPSPRKKTDRRRIVLTPDGFRIL